MFEIQYEKIKRIDKELDALRPVLDKVERLEQEAVGIRTDINRECIRQGHPEARVIKVYVEDMVEHHTQAVVECPHCGIWEERVFADQDEYLPYPRRKPILPECAKK